MNKTYLWLLSPMITGLLAWGLSGNWKLGFWLFLATGLGNYFAFQVKQKR